MALLTSQKPSLSPSAAVTYAAATAGVGGDTFTNTGREFVHVKNGSGAPITVTIDCPNACSFGVTNDAHDLTISVPATSDRMIGPFAAGRFNDASDLVKVTYSAVTSVTVAVLAAS